MKNKLFKRTLLTLTLSFALAGSITVPMPHNAGPTPQPPTENEAPADESGISPLSDLDKLPINIETYSF